MASYWIFVWIVTVCALFRVGGTSPLLKVNVDGGYENIVVAISSKIEKTKGSQLLPKIKDLLQLMSTRLHTVSRRTFYFKKATILVPADWKDEKTLEKFKEATFEVFKEADIRLEDPDWTLGKDIYTQQPRGCGEPGDFIQINANVLEDWTNKKNDIANQMVREWSRLRFGIFEEHGHEGSKIFPKTYQGKDKLFKTACNQPDPWNCSYDSQSEEYLKDEISCDLNSEISSLTSSIMSNTPLPTTTFCDSTNENRHNSEAPTKHNALCHERSTWEVIQSTSDYKNVFAAISDLPNVDVAIVSSVPNSKVVLVIDPELCNTISTKKDIYDTVRFSIAKLIFKEFSNKKPPGVILANGGNTVINNLVNPSSIPNVITTLNNHCYINSGKINKNIQKGLDDAIGMIRTSSSDANSLGVVILVADGLALKDSDFKSFPISSRKDIRFHVVTYPPKTSKFFDGLEATLNWYNVPHNKQPSMCDLEARLQFDEIFQSILGQYDAQFVLRRRLVYQKLHEGLGSGSIGKISQGNSFFALYYCQGQNSIPPPELRVDEKQIILSTPYELSYLIAFTNAIAEPVKNYEVIKVNKGNPFLVSVWYEADNPYRFNMVGEIDQQVQFPPILRASVFWKDAIVTAVITKDTGTSEHINLLGPKDEDTDLNLQFYERYYLSNSINESGYYAVTFTAVGYLESNGPRYNLTSFSSFYRKGADQIDYPPGRITDLYITDINKNGDATTLSWTAPGDELDKGSASMYIIACELNKNNLDISSKNVKIKMSPGQAGTKERYDLYIRHEWPQDYKYGNLFYCAIRAKNSKDITNKRSNFVAIYINKKTETSTTTWTNATMETLWWTNETTKPPVIYDESNSFVNGILGGMISGVICSVFGVLAVILLFYVYRKKTGYMTEMPCNEQNQNNTESGFRSATPNKYVTQTSLPSWELPLSPIGGERPMPNVPPGPHLQEVNGQCHVDLYINNPYPGEECIYDDISEYQRTDQNIPNSNA